MKILLRRTYKGSRNISSLLYLNTHNSLISTERFYSLSPETNLLDYWTVLAIEGPTDGIQVMVLFLKHYFSHDTCLGEAINDS